MYATVNKGAEVTENGIAPQNLTVAADVMQSTGLTVSDEDYAEIKCEPTPVYKSPQENATKAHTIARCAPQSSAVDPESEEYSRLVHITQPNPRFSMPLLSDGDYSQIGVNGGKWRSLEMELDKNQNEALYATPKQKNRSDYENVKGVLVATCYDTPSPLPSPVMPDEPEVSELASGKESKLSGQDEGMKHNDNDLLLDTPKGESPPPLPPPFVEEGDQESSEHLYDEATHRYQNISNCIESGGGKFGLNGKGVLTSEEFETLTAEESAGMLMKTENLEEGIYDSIDQDED